MNRAVAINGPVTVEPRSESLHRLFFTFTEPITQIGGITLRDQDSNPIGHATYQVQPDPRVVRLTLSDIPDASRVRITLVDVNGTQDFSVSMGFLIGDVTSNGSVTAADQLVTRARTGPVTSHNFRSDVNLNGSVDSIDRTIVRVRSGRRLP
ncbi:MAG: hypothetical protein JNK75_11180 [Betaproteobacteria bacterium]|nr:hypothetical protein [Betaproteobacteria bacterium]